MSIQIYIHGLNSTAYDLLPVPEERSPDGYVWRTLKTKDGAVMFFPERVPPESVSPTSVPSSSDDVPS